MYVLRTLDFEFPVYVSVDLGPNLTCLLDLAYRFRTRAIAQEQMNTTHGDYDVVSLDDAINFEIIRSVINA